MKKLVALSIAFAAAVGWAGGASAQDVKAAEGKIAMCTGCHNIPGYQSSFPEVHKVPMIAGQSAKYIANALVAYRKGERKHPTMRAVAQSLTDRDIQDLAAYYEQLGRTEAAAAAPAAAPAPNSPAAQKVLTQGNCASCHGANYSSPIDPSYPKLAGQHADYLYSSLKSYQIDNNAHIGRGNPIMMGMARPYTLAELKAVSEYLASLPGDMKVVPQSRFR